MTIAAIHVDNLLPPINCGFPGYTEGTGMSRESDELSEVYEKAREHLCSSFTRIIRLSEAENALEDIRETSKEENWDSYNSLPVLEETLKEAYKFILYLPLDLPFPDEISADPDGEISFDWYKRTNYLFSISISSNKILSFAGIFGPYSKIHGSDHFDYKIPASILEKIRKFK